MAESILQVAKRADQFFMEASLIHETMRRLSKTLIELKLASGMTAAHRPRDFDDVIQLIRINKLGKQFNALLNPYVVTKFDEMWQAAQVNEDY